MHLALEHKNLIVKALMNLVAKCNVAIAATTVDDFNSIVLIQGYRQLKAKAKNSLTFDVPIDNYHTKETSIIALNTLIQDEPNIATAIKEAIEALTKTDHKTSANLNK